MLQVPAVRDFARSRFHLILLPAPEEKRLGRKEACRESYEVLAVR